MKKPSHCPQCGAALPTQALEGLCPNCMAQIVFGAGKEPEAEVGAKLRTTLRVEPETDAGVERPGTMIGRYKLLEQIGEGGFGVVYMAEQIEPVQRKVALKVIKAGMDTREVIARFEAERQALALMDHPNIAKILDGGVTGGSESQISDFKSQISARRPYFVMELVRGIPITEFCDQKKLSTTERLELFMKVCSAVQHAHQKGIIHRDIKPSNVLVTLHDGEPVPKVIDFGVAKVLGPKLTEKTLFTGFAHLLGTPAYMSPEQAELSGLDVDTRSDIYSLGVLLYELLTGVTPFDRETLAKAALDEIRRLIREVEPVKPSTRLTQERLRAGTSGHSALRTPHSAIDRDLDWIVMKCLEKDRRRRYETANGLAMDIQRHLTDEPIVARPPSKLYEFQKTVRRHKFGFTAAGAVGLALLLGLCVSTFLFLKEQHSRQRADAAASKSEQVARFLKDMLASVGPSVALERDTRLLREILDQTAERIGRDLKGQPEVEAELRSMLAEVYRDLGDYPKAAQMHEAALALLRKHRGEQDVDVAKTLSGLGLVYQSQSRMEDALSAQQKAVSTLTALLPPDHEDLLVARNNLALVLAAQGQVHEAETHFQQILAIRTNTLGDHKHTANTYDNLAGLRAQQGDSSEAVRLHRAALAVRQRLYTGPHPEIALSLGNLGLALYYDGRPYEAETSHVATLEMLGKLLPEKHPHIAIARNNLALDLDAQGNWAKAEELHREVLKLRQEVLPPDHEHTAATLHNLAGVHQQQGRLADAEDYHRQALAMRRRLWSEHMDIVGSLNGLTLLLRDRDKVAEARTNQLEALAMFRRLKIPYPHYEAVLINNLGLIEGDEKNFAEAARRHQEALEIGKNSPPGEVAVWWNNLANVREQQGDLNEAGKLHLQALTLRTNALAPGHPAVGASLESLARVRLKQGKTGEAQSLAKQCLDLWEQRDADDWRAFHARSLLGGSLLAQKNYAAAEPLLRSGGEGLIQREARIPRAARPRLREAVERVVQLYEATGDSAQAAEWRQKLAALDQPEP